MRHQWALANYISSDEEHPRFIRYVFPPIPNSTILSLYPKSCQWSPQDFYSQPLFINLSSSLVLNWDYGKKYNSVFEPNPPPLVLSAKRWLSFLYLVKACFFFPLLRASFFFPNKLSKFLLEQSVFYLFSWKGKEKKNCLNCKQYGMFNWLWFSLTRFIMIHIIFNSCWSDFTFKFIYRVLICKFYIHDACWLTLWLFPWLFFSMLLLQYFNCLGRQIIGNRLWNNLYVSADLFWSESAGFIWIKASWCNLKIDIWYWKSL